MTSITSEFSRRPPLGGSFSADLVTAILQVTTACRSRPGGIASLAAAQGVSPETFEASLIVEIVEHWVNDLPPAEKPDAGMVRESSRVEAVRAVRAMEGGRNAILSLHVPPMLLIRLTELAAENGRTPEAEAVDLMGKSVDAAYTEARKASGKPEVRPWSSRPIGV